MRQELDIELSRPPDPGTGAPRFWDGKRVLGIAVIAVAALLAALYYFGLLRLTY